VLRDHDQSAGACEARHLADELRPIWRRHVMENAHREHDVERTVREGRASAVAGDLPTARASAVRCGNTAERWLEPPNRKVKPLLEQTRSRADLEDPQPRGAGQLMLDRPFDQADLGVEEEVVALSAAGERRVDLCRIVGCKRVERHASPPGFSRRESASSPSSRRRGRKSRETAAVAIS